MANIPRENSNALASAIESHDFLRRVRDEIERLHRVVFHGNERADWSLVRRSADQILIAEIVSRYGGDIDGVYFALRRMEMDGKSWDVAIRDMAAGIHSYYTTPLGVVMRQDLFGPDAIFFTPDAYDWTIRIGAQPDAKQA